MDVGIFDDEVVRTCEEKNAFLLNYFDVKWLGRKGTFSGDEQFLVVCKMMAEYCIISRHINFVFLLPH